MDFAPLDTFPPALCGVDGDEAPFFYDEL